MFSEWNNLCSVTKVKVVLVRFQQILETLVYLICRGKLFYRIVFLFVSNHHYPALLVDREINHWHPMVIHRRWLWKLWVRTKQGTAITRNGEISPLWPFVIRSSVVSWNTRCIVIHPHFSESISRTVGKTWIIANTYINDGVFRLRPTMPYDWSMIVAPQGKQRSYDASNRGILVNRPVIAAGSICRKQQTFLAYYNSRLIVASASPLLYQWYC